MERDIDEMAQSDDMDEDEGRDTDESGDHSDSDDEEEEDPGPFPDVPTVMPRRRFAGAKNIRTVKDGELSLANKRARRLIIRK